MAAISKAEALNAAWSRGLLAYKLRRYQLPVYEQLWRFILDTECKLGCLNVSRRWGKTFCENLIAVEVAIRLPGAQIRAAAPTRLELKNITLPIMKQILSDCPDKYKPKWKEKDHYWEFPNGSEIHLAGANDGHADDLRGTASHLSLVDEAGFVDDLEYLIDSVLMPQTLSTGGTMLISSTPPRSPAHDYCDIAELCKQSGHYIHRDIYTTDFGPSTIEQYMRLAGGADSSTWKREYLALFVVDQELAIVPEWRAAYVGLPEPGNLHRFWHRYESLDLGVRDFTAGGFAYYDFKSAQLCVEDEVKISGPKLVTPLLAQTIREKEKELGYDKSGVYRRVADNNNLQLLNDLRALHDLPFFPTSKDELPAMVNALRMMVGAGRVRIHPRCTLTIGCLEKGVWKNEAHIGREFARTKAYGHFDHLAMLVYMVRNLDQWTNPVPAMYGFNPHSQWINPKVLERVSDTAATIREAFRFEKD